RTRGRRVIALDEQGHERGVVPLGEGPTKAHHVEDTAWTWLQVGTAHSGKIKLVAVGGGQQGATARMLPGPDQPGEADDGPRRRTATGVARQALAESDEGRSGLAIHVSQGFDIAGWHAGDGLDSRRRVAWQHLLRPALVA